MASLYPSQCASGSRPNSALVHDLGALPRLPVKAPRWGSTIISYRPPQSAPLTVFEESSRCSTAEGKERSRYHHGGSLKPRGSMSTANDSAKKWHRSAPALLGSSSNSELLKQHLKTDAVVVSSVSSYIAESNRSKLLLKDFISTRLSDDPQGGNMSEMNNLAVFHCQAARNKTHRRKRPPIVQEVPTARRGSSASAGYASGDQAGIAELAKSTQGHLSAAADAEAAVAACPASAVPVRRGSITGATRATLEMHELCSVLGRTQALFSAMQENSQRQPSVRYTDAARQFVQSQFVQAMKKSGTTDATEDLAQCFGSLIGLLLKKCGSLQYAMELLDYKKKGRLRKDEFEIGVKAKGFSEDPDKPRTLAKIFSVLDQDHDSYISHADLTCYQPPPQLCTPSQSQPAIAEVNDFKSAFHLMLHH